MRSRLMKRALLFSIVSVLFMTPALASGPSAPAPFTWSGLYGGLHLGYGQHDTDMLYDTGSGGTLQSFEADGAVAGVHVGWNQQVAGFVIGIEADASITGIDASSASGSGEAVQDVVGVDLDHLLSLRARLGFASGNWLIYATAGIARAEWDLSFNDGDAPGENGSASISETGAVYGGGVEVALASNLLFRAEYLHYDVGKSLDLGGFLDGEAGDFITVDDVRVFRVGVSAKF